MPPPKGSWDEYRLLHVQTLEWLTKEVRRLSDEVLVFKAKLGIVATLTGGAMGFIGAIGGGLVLHWIKGGT